MARTAITGAVVALLAALLAVVGSALGITTLWPILLAVAVGLAAGGHLTIGRAGAYVAGVVVSWVAMAIAAGVLPQIPLADALVVVLGIAVLTVIAALTADRVPLWAGLAGYAAFAGFYEPIYAANPTLFLSESPVALVTVLLAGGLGIAIALVADLVTTAATDRRTVSPEDRELIDGGVA